MKKDKDAAWVADTLESWVYYPKDKPLSLYDASVLIVHPRYGDRADLRVFELDEFKSAGFSISDIIRKFPGLQKKQVQAALRYWAKYHSKP